MITMKPKSLFFNLLNLGNFKIYFKRYKFIGLHKKDVTISKLGKKKN
jgi:hypothetical protein